MRCLDDLEIISQYNSEIMGLDVYKRQPEDRLDDGQLAEIAGAYMERMGWGGQPYICLLYTSPDT